MARAIGSLLLLLVATAGAAFIWSPQVYSNNQEFQIITNSHLKLEGEGKLVVSSHAWFAFTSKSGEPTIEGKIQTVAPPEWTEDQYFWTDQINTPGEWTIQCNAMQPVYIRPLGDVKVSVYNESQRIVFSVFLVIVFMIVLLFIWQK